MSPREPYAKPSVEKVDVAELAAEAERLTRKAKLELEDLHIVEESVQARIGAMDTALENLMVLTGRLDVVVRRLDAIRDCKTSAWFGNDEATEPLALQVDEP